MRFIYLALVLTFNFISGLAYAQIIQTSEIQLYDQSMDGQPAVCGIEFKFSFKDDVYGSMRTGEMSGSISHAVIKGDFVTLLKVIDVREGNSTPINLASIKALSEFLKPKQFDCERKENFCGSFNNYDNDKILTAFFNDRLEVHYNLESGGIDYAFPISLNKIKNAEKLNDFRKCIGILFKKLPP